MSLDTLLYWALIGICGLIIAIGLTVIGCVFYVLVNVAIEAWQHKHRRPMATKMERDELMLRRLKKSVAIRISTKKLANGK